MSVSPCQAAFLEKLEEFKAVWVSHVAIYCFVVGILMVRHRGESRGQRPGGPSRFTAGHSDIRNNTFHLSECLVGHLKFMKEVKKFSGGVGQADVCRHRHPLRTPGFLEPPVLLATTPDLIPHRNKCEPHAYVPLDTN